MMFAAERYRIRRFVFVKGHSRREATIVFGLSRETAAKMGRFSVPPGYAAAKNYVRIKSARKRGVRTAGISTRSCPGELLLGSRHIGEVGNKIHFSTLVSLQAAPPFGRTCLFRTAEVLLALPGVARCSFLAPYPFRHGRSVASQMPAARLSRQSLPNRVAAPGP